MENGDDARARQLDMMAVSETFDRKRYVEELLREVIPQDSPENDDQLKVISVVDGEAAGKTALVRSVYGRVDVKRCFAYRAWVSLQDNCSVRDVLADIIRQVSRQDYKDADLAKEIELSWRLHEQFFKQRYLVVLDNVKSVDYMVELLTFLIDSNTGSRVIVITRNKDLPTKFIDPWVEPITFQHLTEEDRKLLLQRSMENKVDEQVHSRRPDLMQRILSCSSLSPGEIWLLGGLLSVMQFETVTKCLEEEDKNIVSLCYNDLDRSLQDCIMYVCQFPREYEIPTRRLLGLWLAQSLVPGGIQDAERCFRNLERRNMFHVVSRRKGDGFAKTCRMPGFIYDVLLKKALEINFFEIYSDDRPSNTPNGEPAFFASERIVVYKPSINDRLGGSSEAQEQSNRRQYNVKELRSYMSFNTKKVRTQKRDLDIFLNPRGEKSKLEILDLEGIYKPVLPENLGYVLLHLKYLGLRWTILHELPGSIGSLPHLETLDVKHTNVTKLPSSIWRKKSFHHLYLNDVSFDRSISCRRMLSQCWQLPSYLQTLCGLHIEERNSPMLDVLSKSRGLTKLSLTCPSTLVAKVIQHMSCMTTLQSLRLKSKDMLGQPSQLHLKGMNDLSSLFNLYLFGGLGHDRLLPLPENLKSLTLSMSSLTADHTECLGKLQHLYDLRLYGHSYDGTTLHFDGRMFPKLHILKMWKLDNLKILRMEEEAGPSLEELEIRDCQNLEEIHILGNRKALKEVNLAKVKEELATSLQESLKRSIIITTELIPSATTTEGPPATK